MIIGLALVNQSKRSAHHHCSWTSILDHPQRVPQESHQRPMRPPTKLDLLVLILILIAAFQQSSLIREDPDRIRC